MPIPKKWSEVEMSEAYQSIPPQEKFEAKKEYWETISKPTVEEYNYQNISSGKTVDIADVKKEFFGGILREDIPEISKPEAVLKTIGDTYFGTISTYMGSAGKLASGVVSAASHPVQTVKGLAGIAAGMFQKIIPGEQPQEKYFNDLVNNYKDKYGSLDALAETVATDPFGFVSDVYAVAGLTSGALKTAGKVSGIKSISKAGAMPATEQAISSAIKGLKSKIPFKSLEDKIFMAYNKSFGPKGKIPKETLNLKQSTVEKVRIVAQNLPEENMVNTLTGKQFITPENRYETLIALEAAKKKVWNKSNVLSQGATDAGAKIDLGNVAKQSLSEIKKDFASVAVKTTKKDIITKMQLEVDDLAKLGEITPTQAQDFLKTMTKDVVKQRNSGIPIDYDVMDFRTRLYTNLVNKTDDVIEATLDKSGFKSYRKDYAVLKSMDKEINAGANQYISKIAGKGGGITHPMINLFSLEAVGSGLVSGNILQQGLKATIWKAAGKTLDYMVSKDRYIKPMFERAKKLKKVEPIHVFNPEILEKVSVTKMQPKQLSYSPKKIKQQRLFNESSGDIIITEDPIKRLTYNPNAEGIRFGMELPGEYKGGFGQFIMKESEKLKNK